MTEFLRRHGGKVAGVLMLLIAGTWLYLRRDDLSRDELMAYGRSLPAIWFLVAFLALPLAGVPISLFLILAGVRFGFWGGMAVAAVGISVHHILAYRLVHGRPRESVRARLRKAGYTIPSPSGNNWVGVAAIFAAIHGPPYAVKLYALALTDIPFRVYFWVGAPVYILFCAPPVGAGSSVMFLNPLWLYAGIFALSGIGLLGRWLKKRYGSIVADDADITD